MTAQSLFVKRLLHTLPWVFVLLLLATPVFAQAGLDVLVIKSGDGAPVAGISVQVENREIGLKLTVITNGQGKARFSALSTAGKYVVSVLESDAFAEQHTEDVILRTNFDRSVTMVLSPRMTRTEHVSVEAGTGLARVNTVNAEVSSTMTQRELEALPVEGRDATRSLYRLPNVTLATGFYPEAPNVGINGANSLYANYMIDGLDNNENFLGGQKFAIPVGFTQDVTVLAANYSTEFGRTGNGIFNFTSRSGGNTFSGEAFYLTRPGPRIDASSAFAQRDLSGNAVKDGFERRQGGVALSGPIVRDRTFFSFDLETTKDYKDNLLNVPELGVNETVAGTNRFNYFSGKITQQWSPNFTSTLRANVGHVTIERQGGGLDGGVTFPSAANTQERNSALVAIGNKYVTNRLVSETNVQYSWFRWDYGGANNGPGAQTVVLDPAGQTIAVLGHPGYVFDDTEHTLQLQQKETLSLGNHLLKGGLEVVSSGFSLAGGGNENGNYKVQLNPTQLAALKASGKGASLGVEDIPSDVNVLDYNVELHPATFGKRQNIYSTYVEDVWSVTSELNLTLGLRYDYDNLSKGGAERADGNNVAPRFGFNYQLSPRSAIRGGAGVFYDKILYAIYSDALQQNTTSQGFRSQIQQLIDLGILPRSTKLDRVLFDGNLSANPPLKGITYLQGPTSQDLQGQRENATSNERRILNPNGYKNPYTEQFSAGYQLQIGARMLFYADLIHTQSYDLFRLRDLNAPTSYPVDPANPDDVVVRTQRAADCTRPLFKNQAQCLANFAIPDGGARNIVVTESKGESRYNAANFSLVTERGKLPLVYRFSYTLSRLTNNTEDINFRAQDSNRFGAEWGPSINDRTHVISGVVSYFPFSGLTVTLAALVQSGQPVNRIPDGRIYGTTDLNGDGRSFGDSYDGNSDRSPGERRNSDRLPWSKSFDVAAIYKFPVFKHVLELRADVFNIFNTVNLSGYSNNATQSNQIQVGPRSDGIEKKNSGPPRQYQFGLRYAF